MPITLPQKPNRPLASMRGDHVGLQVADLDAAMRWYVEKLDFRVSSEGSSAPLRFVYLHPPVGDFRIELVGGASPTPKPAFADLPGSMATEGYHHLCLNVEDLDAVLAELRRRDVRVLAGPFFNKSIGQNLLFVADPWGNVIELAQNASAVGDEA